MTGDIIMYNIDQFIVKVHIRMDNGVYTLPTESAIGKTYLAYLLKQYRGAGEPVASFTYYDFIYGEELSYFVSKRDYKVVLLDRYDLYNDKFENEIFKLGEHAVVLLDAKRFPLFTCEHGKMVGIAYLNYSEKNLIEVGSCGDPLYI